MIFTALVALALRLCGQGFFRSGELAPENARRVKARQSTINQRTPTGGGKYGREDGKMRARRLQLPRACRRRLLQRPMFVQRRRFGHGLQLDRKSTRLNSSHQLISYAVFCLKKKKKQQ